MARPGTDAGADDETWPRSSEAPLADLDLKRPGKIDPALRQRVLRGAAGQPRAKAGTGARLALRDRSRRDAGGND